MSSSRIRILTKAILVVAIGTLCGIPAAAARPERPATVKFVLDYRGNLNASWHNTTAVNQRSCSGDDTSGSLTSSIRPGSKRYTLVISKEFGHLYLQWPNAVIKGAVSSNRTAQGWMMVSGGGKPCHQEPRPFGPPGCAAYTFAGPVALEWAGGSQGASRNRITLFWQKEPWIEPGTPTGCFTGEVYDFHSDAPAGAGYAKLNTKALYRCGVRKPRTCKFKIGSSTDFPYHVTQGDATYDSSVHIDWSVTFKRVRR